MKHYLLILTAFLFLGLTSCDKKQKGTFTIKGHLLQDCSGSPVVGRRISVRERVIFGHGKDEIGSVTTDNNGYFELVAGYFSPNPKEVKGLPGEYDTPRMPRSGQTIDLGNIYSKFAASVTLEIHVLSNSYNNDTLFVKDVYLGNTVDSIYPLLEGEYFHVFSYNVAVDWAGRIRNEGNDTSYLNYSIDTVINGLLEYRINYCGLSKDTVIITLP